MPAPPAPTPVPAQDIADRRARGEKLTLLDVREHDEVAICRIEGAIHIPMNDVPARIAEIDRTQPVAVYCHHGMRSRMVGAFLLQEGFTEVWNLNGGIDAWAAAVDPAMARY